MGTDAKTLTCTASVSGKLSDAKINAPISVGLIAEGTPD